MSSNRSSFTGAFGGLRRRNHANPTISVVVPAKNEALNLTAVLPLLPAVHEVILVDGHSTDGTVEAAVAALPGIKVVRQVRKGKGNALAAGFAAVTGDITVMFDADGSADPDEIARFVEVLKDGADFAKGSRFTTGGGSADITPIRHAGNWGLNAIFNVLFRSRYSDLCYGYNAFWSDLIPVLDLPDHAAPMREDGQMSWGDGFEIETLINCRFASAGVQIAEVASVEKLRLHGESNLNAITDGLRVLKTLATEWLRARALRRQAERLAIQPATDLIASGAARAAREVETVDLAELNVGMLANPRRVTA
jgi:glycosyltransferase involved in cell wall biosynthesis